MLTVRCAGLGVVDPVQLVAMHKAKQQADSTEGGSSGTSGSGKPAAAPAGSATGCSAGFEPGEADSLGRYDPETDKFVGGSAGVNTCGYEATGEEQLALKRNGGDGEGGMTKKGTEWGLLQLDLSFGWEMEDKPVEDVEQLLQETSARMLAAAQ